MYIHPASETVFADHSAIRAGLNVLFSEVITEEDLAYHGVFPVAQVDPAAGPGQVAVPGMPVQVDGEWTQTWTLRDETPEEVAAKIAESVPQSVTRRQGLQALYLAGVTEAMIEAKIIELLDGNERALALIEFRTSQTFERNRQLVIQMGAAFGLDLNAIFTTAHSIP